MDSSDKSFIDSLETFKDLFDNAYDLIHIVHPDGTIIYVNNAWEKHLEYSQKEVQGQSIYLLVYSEDRDAFKNYRSEVITGRLLDNNIEVRMQSKSGKIITVEGFLSVRTSNNKAIYTRGIFRDISKRIENEFQLRLLNETLKERENNLQQLLIHAPDAVIVIDKQSIISYWNPKARELFGWSEQEAVGRNLADTIIPPQYREAHTKGMNRYLSTGQAHVLNQSIEVTALNKDGKEFYISLTISTTIQNGDLAFIAFIRNIDKEKRNELELDKKRKELEQSNKELEQFAYVASHDLQEPIRKVHLYSNMVLADTNLNKRSKEHLEKVIASAERMKGLVNSLLNFSRHTRQKYEFEKVSLSQIIQQVLVDYELLIEEKEARIQIDSLPTIEANPIQLTQLFYNLIGNSLKFSKMDIQPLITVSSEIINEERTSEWPQLNPGAEYIEVNITDNGVGFDQEYASKIFSIFQRLPHQKEFEGYGIGLAICKKIIENHKGVIWAEGTVNQGAKFHFILPCTQSK